MERLGMLLAEETLTEQTGADTTSKLNQQISLSYVQFSVRGYSNERLMIPSSKSVNGASN